MTAFTLGEAAGLVLGRVGARMPDHLKAVQRVGVPVRRNSLEAGSFEQLFFAVPAQGECDLMVRAARDALEAGRRLKRTARAEGRALTSTEATLAALTSGAIRVFEELCTLARLNRGRVYPSYDRIADVTALGRATVARALVLLEAAGFLRRQRRFRKVEGVGAGPRYAQTSNAYRPMVAPHLERLLRTLMLGRRRPPAPKPDDAVQHVKDQADKSVAMLAGLGCRDLARATVDGVLGRVLERFGAALDRNLETSQRESHDDPQQLHKFINRGPSNPVLAIGMSM